MGGIGLRWKHLRLKEGAAPARKRHVPHEMLICIEFNSYLNLLKVKEKFGIDYTHIPNGGLRARKTAADLMRMGVTPGIWDYLFRKPGLPPHWIEMKYDDGKLTPNQIMWGDAMFRCGDTTDVCKSARQALDSLVSFGYLPKESFEFIGSMFSMQNINPNNPY